MHEICIIILTLASLPTTSWTVYTRIPTLHFRPEIPKCTILLPSSSFPNGKAGVIFVSELQGSFLSSRYSSNCIVSLGKFQLSMAIPVLGSKRFHRTTTTKTSRLLLIQYIMSWTDKIMTGRNIIKPNYSVCERRQKDYCFQKTTETEVLFNAVLPSRRQKRALLYDYTVFVITSQLLCFQIKRYEKWA